MQFNINIYAVIILIVSAIVGFGGGFIAGKITTDEKKVTNLKIVFKSVAMLGIIAALLISIYFN